MMKEKVATRKWWKKKLQLGNDEKLHIVECWRLDVCYSMFVYIVLSLSLKVSFWFVYFVKIQFFLLFLSPTLCLFLLHFLYWLIEFRQKLLIYGP